MAKISIAIDGHSSTGKSTVAQRLAHALGYIYIDTGAMYRAVTLYALENNYVGGGTSDFKGLIRNLEHIALEFRETLPGKELHIFLNGRDVDAEIRDLTVSQFVSQVSELAEVRDKLVRIQREIARDHGVVMDGRDIGTVVLPDAELKIFMTAAPEKRAMRRYDELKARGDEVEFEAVKHNIETRDHIDSTRDIAPLKKAADAILIDNTDLDLETQFEMVHALAIQAIKAQKKGC